jgi:hypothetical protein
MDAKQRRHAQRDPRRRRAAIGVFVLVLHALLGFALLSTMVRQRGVPESPRVSVRLLPARVESPPSPPSPRSRPPATMRPPIATTARTQTRPHPAERAADPSEQSVLQVQAAPITAEAASAPPPLLDTEASRRAIRSAARNPNLASRVDEQVGVHSPTAAQRIPGNIQQAGKGDCIKTGYPGAGMGLLSLPFFAAALATGNCAQ